MQNLMKMAQLTTFISHVADNVKHITAAERTAWNAYTTAISEVRTKAENSGFALLKTQVINTGNVYYKSGYGANFVQITGVDLSLYGRFDGAFRVVLKLTKEGAENPDAVLKELDKYKPILVKA